MPLMLESGILNTLLELRRDARGRATVTTSASVRSGPMACQVEIDGIMPKRISHGHLCNVRTQPERMG